jgi:cytochrome c553
MNVFVAVLLATQSADENMWNAIAVIAAGLFVLAFLKSLFSSGEDKSLWLNCTRCHELAAPIEKTKDRYRCPHCSNQFAGAPH